MAISALVRIEKTKYVEFYVDTERFRDYYAGDWIKFAGDNEVTTELVLNFIKESVHEIGLEEFMRPTDDDEELGITWADNDDDSSVKVQEA